MIADVYLHIDAEARKIIMASSSGPPVLLLWVHADSGEEERSWARLPSTSWYRATTPGR